MSPHLSRAAGAVALAAACAVLAAPAQAAPVAGPSGDAFYSPPTSVPEAGQPGELIWYRPANVKLGTGAPAAKAWTVLYRSSDSRGTSNFVTGTVLVPTATVRGARPLVAFAPGTQGLAKSCAPSRQLVAGTEYEAPDVALGLANGYALAVTDYAGYTVGDTPTYLAGASEGHATLDILRAARQLPGANLSPSGQTAVWGYSQGGQAAGFAGEQASSYAPELKLAGIAAGGIPGDFVASARTLDRAEGAAFLFGAVLGLEAEYPDAIPFAQLANDAGRKLKAQTLEQGCIFKLLNQFRNVDIAQFTKDGQGLEGLLRIPSVQQTLAAQRLGTRKVDVPVYQWHGQADEFLPLGQAYDLKKSWCAAGSNVTFDLYPSEHLATLFQGAPAALSFLADRFAGKPVSGTCATTRPDPASTADTPGGDFVVGLTDWRLSGTARLAKLNQSLSLPADATISGSGNLSSESIVAAVDIPPFFTTIDILGLKVRTSLQLVPTGKTTGSIRLDDDGNLHLAASSPLSLRIKSLTAVGINFGTNCRTQGTMHVPIRFDGPVSALGTGALTSRTTATIPPLTGCGLYGPLLSALISGSGNAFALNLAPPGPIAN